MNSTIERVPAVQRSFSILEHLAKVREANPSEAARTLNLPRTAVLRILTTLTEMGYVSLNEESGRYALAPKLFSLGLQAELPDVVNMARQRLSELRDQTGETVELAVIEDGRMLVLDCLDSPRSIRLHARPGRRFPLYRMATGRVLMAGMPEETLHQIFKDGSLEESPYKIEGGWKGLKALAERVSRQGYALDERFAREDVERISAPIRNRDGTLAAALGIAGPAFRLKPTRALISSVQAFARKISEDAGYSGH